MNSDLNRRLITRNWIYKNRVSDYNVCGVQWLNDGIPYVFAAATSDSRAHQRPDCVVVTDLQNKSSSLVKVWHAFGYEGASQDPASMRQILQTEGDVPVPPMVMSDPFFRITYLIKEEIRKYKWIETEKGRALSWEQARQEWTDLHRESFEKFLTETLTSL